MTRDDQELVSKGTFVLDQQKALEKLRDYQLPTAHHHLLEFIKAAHLLEALWIDVSIERNQVVLEFDGDVLTAEELGEIFSAPFSRSRGARQRALRHLAIGLHAARGLGLAECVLESGGDVGVGISVAGEEFEEYSLSPAAALPSTRVRLRRPGGLRALRRFVGRMRGVSDEEEFLRERCRYSDRHIDVNGERVSQGLSLGGETWAQVGLQGEGWAAVVGVVPSSTTVEATFVQHGVVLETTRWPAGWCGAQALVDAGMLKTDLSQSSLVQDQQWQAVVDQINAGVIPSFVRFLKEAPEVLARDHHLRAAVWRAMVSVGAEDLMRDEADEILEAAGNLPPDPALEGERVRLQDLRDRIRQWQQAPAGVHPDKGRYPHRLVRRLSGRWSVAAGLTSEERSSEVLFLREGRLFCRRPLEVALTGLVLVIDGDFEVSRGFDEPRPSRSLDKAATASVEICGELLARYEPEMNRQWAALAFASIVDGSLRRALRTAFRWSEWPEVIREGKGWSPLISMGSVDFQEGTLDDRVGRLERLGGREIFEDLRGKWWSVEDLAHWCHQESFTALAVAESAGEVEDERLSEVPVLVAGSPGLAGVARVLGAVLVTTETFLEMMEKRAIWQERSAGASLMSGTDFSSPTENTVPRPPAVPGAKPEVDEERSEAGEDQFLRQVSARLSQWEGSFLVGPEHWANLRVVEGIGVAAKVEGEELYLNGEDPAIRGGIDGPDDPVAIAFALLAIHRCLENALYGGRRAFVELLVATLPGSDPGGAGTTGSDSGRTEEVQ